jgi:uncharacterized protein with PIN domain
METHSAEFRFYAELNYFLPADKQKRSIVYRFNGNPSVKDAIESLGVPHTEVDLIIANGTSVGFDYHLQSGDRIAIYPMFESLDISSIAHVRRAPLRQTAFVLDVHLGKLARLLRMLGVDTLYRNDYDDPEIVDISLNQHRIILTRDRGILKRTVVTHGYYVKSNTPKEQLREVIRRFDLADQINPFHRCIACNGILTPVNKEDVLSELPPKTSTYFEEFHQCNSCGKIYWKGSHYQRMKKFIGKLRENCYI